MLSLTYAINFLTMLAAPVILWFVLVRRWGLGWRLVGWGALTFVASQAVRLPMLFGLTALFQLGLLPAPPEAFSTLFNVVVLSVSAGLFEEGARYLGYRRFLRDARSWRAGVLYGAGHGGIEAILIGLAVALTFVNMVALRNVDPATLPIPFEQQQLLAAQVTAYWSAPWYLTLLGGLERIFAICLHLSLAALVLQAVVRRNVLWLLAAIAWHSLVNAAAVSLLPVLGPLAVEGVVGVSALISLAILFGLRRPEPPASTGRPGSEPQPLAPVRPSELGDLTADELDASRYSGPGPK